MLWDDAFRWGLAYLIQLPLLVNGRGQARLFQASKMGPTGTPVYQGTAFSLYLSLISVIRRKTLWSLDHFFWGYPISGWGFSPLMTCLLELEACYRLMCFALESETAFGYTRNKVSIVILKWVWHFAHFPSHKIRSLQADLMGLLEVCLHH